MSFESDLKAHLQAGSAVSALVADRIHPGIVPEGSSLPVVTYTHAFGAPEICLDGFTSGVTRYAMQFDCWALTYDEVVALALAVRDRLNTAASTFAVALTEFPSFDDYEPDTKRYRRSIGAAIRFKE
jgi:hypothetical protein